LILREHKTYGIYSNLISNSAKIAAEIKADNIRKAIGDFLLVKSADVIACKDLSDHKQ